MGNEEKDRCRKEGPSIHSVFSMLLALMKHGMAKSGCP